MGGLDDVIAILETALAPDHRGLVLAVALADVPDIGVMVVVALLQTVRLVADALRELPCEAAADRLLRLLPVQDAMNVRVLCAGLLERDDKPVELLANP